MFKFISEFNTKDVVGFLKNETNTEKLKRVGIDPLAYIIAMVRFSQTGQEHNSTIYSAIDFLKKTNSGILIGNFSYISNRTFNLLFQEAEFYLSEITVLQEEYEEYLLKWANRYGDVTKITVNNQEMEKPKSLIDWSEVNTLVDKMNKAIQGDFDKCVTDADKTIFADLVVKIDALLLKD